MERKLKIITEKCPQNHKCPAVNVCPVGAINNIFLPLFFFTSSYAIKTAPGPIPTAIISYFLFMHELYGKIEKYLEDNGIELMFETIVDDLKIENGICTGVKVKKAKEVENEKAELEIIEAEKVVVAVGRKFSI